MSDYTCGTCGTGTLVLRAKDFVPELALWTVKCGQGHPLVPTGDDITIVVERLLTADENEQRLWEQGFDVEEE
jgi:hypothetical protein